MSLTQFSFSRFNSSAATDAEAKALRDAKYRELVKAGIKAKRWKLSNQLRKYASFGVPDGSIYDAYYINVIAQGEA